MKHRLAIILILIISAGLALALPWILSRERLSIGPLTLEMKTISYDHSGKDNRSTYSIESSYPVFTDGLSDEIEGKINIALSVWAEHTTATVKRDFEDTSSSIWLGVEDSYVPPVPLTFDSLATTSAALDKLPFLNVTFTNEEYTGGAHGVTAIKTFVFDTRTGNEITLRTLFTGDYLTALSRLSLAEIKKVDPDLTTFTFANDGTLPDSKNFSAFTLKPDGMHIIFGDYQVAPYAAGQPEIVLPYTALSSVIAPAYKDILK